MEPENKNLAPSTQDTSTDPKVNAALLADLSTTDSQFAASLLDSIFIKKEKTTTSLTQPQINVVSKLITSVPTSVMKEAFLDNLSKTNKIKVVNMLNYSQQLLLFTFHNDTQFLTQLFKAYKETQQKQILSILYKKNPYLYESLKKEMKTKTHYIEHVKIEKSSDLTKTYKKERELILDIFQNPSIPKEVAFKESKRLLDHYDLNEVETFTFEIIDAFTDLNIDMNSPPTFLIYLKFYFFMASFLEVFPNTERILKPNLEKTVIFLSNLPSAEWIVKVLNQFPVKIIKLIKEILISYNRQTDSKIRNIYSKLLTTIITAVDSTDCGNVKFVFKNM
ncbi:hypothetical protein HOH45_02485 [bacterium]|nr:hypothetical protein [bacterium]